MRPELFCVGWRIHIELAIGDCRFEASYASVVSGEEEGVYGWIAVNYLNGHLAPSALPAPVVLSCPCSCMCFVYV